MAAVVQEVVVDCAEPAALAQFWAQVLEARWALVDPGWAVVDATPLIVAFQQVPEPKPAPKNRVHLDVRVPDAAAAVARAEALGAHRTGHQELRENGDGYVVLQDPEGNEFCFVVDESGRWAGVLWSALEHADQTTGLPATV
ncbi:MAG: hypothetical protein BGO38_16960 [Cellulomonas sp. 73-145]|uniref:VOC family protein n=1 Tax=Cellulomonas sp. 73-145 TaxID=1895739 RepID=UPI000927066A|nr:VOC family protein [Cellulomonas sp. 73-145]MBN9327467.1 VOC family protein [Cellulomonas sp.]OJV59003.1 MAG: hypothetical protein BGO38_16960 [Cellulomonas sp. 73-145]